MRRIPCQRETTMRAKVILNPYANRWGARRRADQVREAMIAAGISADMVEVPAPGPASDWPGRRR